MSSKGIDELREHVRILASFLDDPEPGLFTWGQAVYERIQMIKQYGLSSLDHAAPELLEACKALQQWCERECLPVGGPYDAPSERIWAAIAKAEE